MMKLATLKNMTRATADWLLFRRTSRAAAKPDNIAPTLQAALDNWEHCAPRLEALYRDVEHQAVPCERFHENDAHSPLPRAYQWADGSAYINHVELVRKGPGGRSSGKLLS